MDAKKCILTLFEMMFLFFMFSDLIFIYARLDPLTERNVLLRKLSQHKSTNVVTTVFHLVPKI